MKTFFQKKNGFTLLEMVIYVALLAVVSILAINITFTMLRAYSDIRVSRDINNSATVVLETMVREIRNAVSVDTGQSILTSNPGVLLLNTKDSSGADTTVEFYLADSVIKMKEGGIDQGSLHPSSVVADNIVYYLTSGANSDAVRVEMQLTATRGNFQKTRKFYSTAVLRGSY